MDNAEYLKAITKKLDDSLTDIAAMYDFLPYETVYAAETAIQKILVEVWEKYHIQSVGA